MTSREAWKLIEDNQDDTAFYGKNNKSLITGELITYNDIYDMLRGHANMGKAETSCIIAALRLTGATFAGELTKNY